VDEEVERVARALATAPTKAYGEIRGLLANTFTRDLREGLGAEHEAILRTAATGEARERVGRFGVPRGVRY
jgi:2-(1,2-epoxy-1,2-dihydrophenyl)acetyl-CoA isomerase